MISNYAFCEDKSIRKMVIQMKAKYDKYWENVDNVNILLFIVLILDPRYKLSYVEFFVRRSYEGEKANMLFSKITVTLTTMFELYSSSLFRTKRKVDDMNVLTILSSTSEPIDACCENSSGKTKSVSKLTLEMYQKEKGTLNMVTKIELDKYLDAACEDNKESFDILHYWKNAKIFYLVVSEMVKDVLAMPVSTVASESAFSTKIRVLDSFRTSLTPKMIEALTCTQDWLRKSHSPLILENAFLSWKIWKKRKEN